MFNYRNTLDGAPRMKSTGCYLLRIDFYSNTGNALFQTILHLNCPCLEGIALFAAQSSAKATFFKSVTSTYEKKSVASMFMQVILAGRIKVH